MTETTNKISVPIAIVLAGVLIAGAILFTKGQSPTPSTSDTNKNAEISMRAVSSSDHLTGSPNADLIIVEYSDTECPYCKDFQKTLEQVMATYGKSGQVAWVYRHFPIASLHSKAQKEAEATECAAELGGKAMFWDYINKVFAVTPSNNNLDPAKLITIATDLKLDATAFKACLDSGRHAGRVEADYKDAIASGGTGTPHSIILTKKGIKIPIEGAYSYEQMKQIIDGLLKAK